MKRTGPHSFRDREPAPGVCPTCSEVLDAATNTEGDRAPKAGDVSVCAYCATLLIFEDERHMRELDPNEIAADLLARLEGIAAVVRKHPLPRKLRNIVHGRFI